MNKLLICIAEALDDEGANFCDDFDYTQHPNWDSMAQLALVVKIEEEFGRVIDGSVFKNHPTIMSLKEFLVS